MDLAFGEETTAVAVSAVDRDGVRQRSDLVAVEEPLEIRLAYRGLLAEPTTRSIAVTMRTPGHDFELAVGFLFAEGIVADASAIADVTFCGPPPPDRPQSNIVRVTLHDEVAVDLKRLQRNFFSTSSCGICGKASLDALDFEGGPTLAHGEPIVGARVIHELPERLRRDQGVFDATGGLHAAGLFTAEGELLACREDVGRHNAVDKLVGAQILAGEASLANRVLVVSGRVSFEILQKALAASLPIVVAVGAPSSLAVKLAERFGITLVGFARDGRFNIYGGDQRIARD